MQIVTSSLEKSLGSLNSLQSHVLSGNDFVESTLNAEIIRQLEIQRMCCEFIESLLIDTGDTKSNSYNFSKSSEIPLIPKIILEGCMGHASSSELQKFILISVSFELRNLEQQGNFHQMYRSTKVGQFATKVLSTLETCVSPIVIERILLFINDFMR